MKTELLCKAAAVGKVAAAVPSGGPSHGVRRLPNAPRHAASFTLVEVLVSIAILSILSLLLAAMLSQVTLGWGRVKAQIDTRQNGRSILTLMSADLRPAALPKDRSNTNNLQFVINPPAIPANSAGGTNYLFPHAFFWQAPIATDTSLGNMAEVGYFIRWDTTTKPSNPRAMLCRYFVNPGINNNGTPNTNYLIYSNPTNWCPTGTGAGALDTVAPGTQAGNYQGWVADNVIGLWVRALDSNGYPITTDSGVTSAGLTLMNYAFDSRRGYSMNTEVNGLWQSLTISAYQDSAGGQPAMPFMCSLPYAVEIAVVVLDARTASVISSVSTNGPTSFKIYGGTSASPGGNPYATASTPKTYWNDINAFMTNLPSRIQKGARVYSTRVQLVNGAK